MKRKDKKNALAFFAYFTNQSALPYNKNLALIKMNADFLFTVMDNETNTVSNDLRIEFHAVWK